ncbi:MAG TPA: acetolactate synthase small subunit, partial [Methanosphaera sp.]|nr:acetolactate synthase small subunit [Methanosphaera sp.]
TPKTITIEISGKPDNINALIDLLRPYGIKEVAKTGITALSRGQKTL